MSDEGHIEERLRSGDRTEVLRAMDELEDSLRRKEWTHPIPPSLLMPLGSGDPEMRKKAIWLIGKFAQNKIAGDYPLDVLATMTSDPDEEIRENAAWAIGEATSLGFGGRHEEAVLVSLLADGSSQVRGMAAWALGRLAERRGTNSPEAKAKLSSLREDTSEYVRKTAAWALERY